MKFDDMIKLLGTDLTMIMINDIYEFSDEKYSTK